MQPLRGETIAIFLPIKTQMSQMPPMSQMCLENGVGRINDEGLFRDSSVSVRAGSACMAESIGAYRLSDLLSLFRIVFGLMCGALYVALVYADRQRLVSRETFVTRNGRETLKSENDSKTVLYTARQTNATTGEVSQFTATAVSRVSCILMTCTAPHAKSLFASLASRDAQTPIAFVNEHASIQREAPGKPLKLPYVGGSPYRWCSTGSPAGHDNAAATALLRYTARQFCHLPLERLLKNAERLIDSKAQPTDAFALSCVLTESCEGGCIEDEKRTLTYAHALLAHGVHRLEAQIEPYETEKEGYFARTAAVHAYLQDLERVACCPTREALLAWILNAFELYIRDDELRRLYRR